MKCQDTITITLKLAFKQVISTFHCTSLMWSLDINNPQKHLSHHLFYGAVNKIYFTLHSDHRQTSLTCLLISTKREYLLRQLPLLPGLPRVVDPERLHQDDLTALGCLVVVVAVAPAAHRVHGAPSCPHTIPATNTVSAFIKVSKEYFLLSENVHCLAMQSRYS